LGQITLEELNVMSRLPHYCPVCAYHNWNLDGLVEMIWEYLDLLRIYTKPKVGARSHTMHPEYLPACPSELCSYISPCSR
jgi:ribosome-interacting GTPase 1